MISTKSKSIRVSTLLTLALVLAACASAAQPTPGIIPPSATPTAAPTMPALPTGTATPQPTKTKIPSTDTATAVPENTTTPALPTVTKPPEATATPVFIKGEVIEGKESSLIAEGSGVKVIVKTAKDVPGNPIIWNRQRNPNAEADITSWWRDFSSQLPEPVEKGKFEIFARLPGDAGGRAYQFDKSKPLELIWG